MRDYKNGLHLVPDHMREGIILYLEMGMPGGGFQQAVLANDLVGALMRADFVNRQRMREWAEFLSWHCPEMAWGSPEKVAAWCKGGGLKGELVEQ